MTIIISHAENSQSDPRLRSQKPEIIRGFRFPQELTHPQLHVPGIKPGVIAHACP